MPNVYTRTGDKGLTGLFGGSRVPKLDPGVEAYGTVDEANAAIGQAKALATDEPIRNTLHGIQQRLFVLAAELASDAKGRAILDNTISATDVKELEDLIDMCRSVTGPQRNFVVPGRDVPSASLHEARTVARRAERRVGVQQMLHALHRRLSPHGELLSRSRRGVGVDTHRGFLAVAS